MSDREKLTYIANTLDEHSLSAIVAMADGYLHQKEEMMDDLYCAKLADEADANPDKTTYSFDDFVKQLRENEDAVSD